MSINDKKVDVVATCSRHGPVGMDNTIAIFGRRWCSACLIEALEEMDVFEVEMVMVDENGHLS